MASLSQLTTDISKKFKKTNPNLRFDPSKMVEFIPSGNIVFDFVSGGGFPRGRLSEVFGLEHSGKTALTLLMAGEQQKLGGTGIFMDHELAWHVKYAEKTYGVVQDDETFTVFQPSNIEEADSILDSIEDIDKLDYMIFDSVDAMRPKGQIERSQAESEKDPRHPGDHARAMSDFVHKIHGYAHRHHCAIIFLNQMRNLIKTRDSAYEQSAGSGAGYNPRESFTTTGGNALRYYASLRMKCEYAEKIKNLSGVDIVMGDQGAEVRKGSLIKLINVKNKVYTPYLKGVSHFVFPTPDNPGGWQRSADLIDMLKRRGKVRQAGSRFTYNGLKPEFAEWVSTNCKAVESEEKFCSNPAILKDAEELLSSLIGRDEGAKLLDRAIQGIDFTDEEQDDSYKPQGSEEEEGPLKEVSF